MNFSSGWAARPFAARNRPRRPPRRRLDEVCRCVVQRRGPSSAVESLDEPVAFLACVDQFLPRPRAVLLASSRSLSRCRRAISSRHVLLDALDQVRVQQELPLDFFDRVALGRSGA